MPAYTGGEPKPAEMIEIEAVFSGISKFFSGFLRTLSQTMVAEKHVSVDDLANRQCCLLLFIRVFRHPDLNQVVFLQPEAAGPRFVDEDGGIPHPMMQGHQNRIIPRLYGGKRGERRETRCRNEFVLAFYQIPPGPSGTWR